MAETKSNVRTILVNYACDKCSKNPNSGCILKQTGRTVLVLPPKFEYQCPHCEELFWMEESYPKTEYQVMNN